MRLAIDGREEELSFKVDRRRSRRHHPVVITDTDFANDITITTEEIHETQEMLASVEVEAAKSDFILILIRRRKCCISTRGSNNHQSKKVCAKF